MVRSEYFRLLRFRRDGLELEPEHSQGETGEPGDESKSTPRMEPFTRVFSAWNPCAPGRHEQMRGTRSPDTARRIAGIVLLQVGNELLQGLQGYDALTELLEAYEGKLAPERLMHDLWDGAGRTRRIKHARGGVRN